MDSVRRGLTAHQALQAAQQQQQAGQLLQAEAAYRRALELNPDYAEAHNNLGNVLYALERMDEAERHFRRALDLRPDSGLIYANLGKVLALLGRQGEAEACLRRALAIEPQFAEAHNDLGNLLQQRGLLDEAEACYRRAADLKPGLAVADLNLRNVALAKRMVPVLDYCPTGWDESRLEGAPPGWNADSIVEATRAATDELYRLQDKGVIFGGGHQHNLHASFAYVLARAAGGGRRLSVLDWGGGSGHLYRVARAAFPEIELDFHCKETEVLAAAGRESMPGIRWHADESCLAHDYDVVVMSGSLQYARDWKDTLNRIARAASRWLFLTRLPVVRYAPTFAAIQHVYGSTMLHWQFNRSDVLGAAGASGFVAACEFETGERPHVRNAPEQCELRGWLFRRNSSQTAAPRGTG